MPFNTKTATSVAIVFLITIALCSSAIQERRTQFVKNKLLSTSYATKQPISKLQCVEWCSRDNQNGKCKTAGYTKSSKTCKLSMDYERDLLNVTDESTGVFLVEKEGDVCYLK